MRKMFLGILILLLPAMAFAQASTTPSSYQPATITSVKPHQGPESSNPDDALYEVSIRAGETVYVVLTPVPPPAGSAPYAVGRQVLVRIGVDTITWNDIMGQSYKAAILSRTQIGDPAKPQS